MKEICDFANSHLTFELANVNSARINLDARCTWIEGGEEEQFLLVCPCQGENMYVPRNLVKDPPYNFFGVFSGTQSHLIRDLADADTVMDTVENHKGRFDDIRIHLAPFKNAVELTTDQAIVDATLRNLPLIGRTEIKSDDGKISALMEYPITTMNVEPGKKIWQIDTGPILFADFKCNAAQRIEKLVPAFIVCNTREYAELAIRTVVKLPKGGSTHHYADPRGVKTSTSLYSGMPL